MKELKIIRGTYGYDLEFNLVNQENKPIDLTGATVYLRVQKYGVETLHLDKIMTIVNAKEGIVSYRVEKGDFEEVDAFRAELELRWTDRILTSERFLIRVKSDLPE